MAHKKKPHAAKQKGEMKHEGKEMKHDGHAKDMMGKKEMKHPKGK